MTFDVYTFYSSFTDLVPVTIYLIYLSYLLLENVMNISLWSFRFNKVIYLAKCVKVS